MADATLAPRAHVTPAEGLTAAEVAERVRDGQVNVADDRTSRTLGEILRANVFTRFNALLGTMWVLILVFGDARDGLFGFVLVFNTLIGVVQEWRAKRTLDRLAVLSAPRAARQTRDGRTVEVAVDAIVLDDVVEMRSRRPGCGRRQGVARVPASSSTSRCSPANPIPSRSTRVTTCSRAASSSPAPDASRPPQ